MEENKIVLRDEEGKEQAFELVITLELNDKTYVLLADEEQTGVFPFIFEYDEEHGENLYPVEDEKEFELIESAYSQLANQAQEGCSCGCSTEGDCKGSDGNCCSSKE